jgi:DNA relaxase NicK
MSALARRHGEEVSKHNRGRRRRVRARLTHTYGRGDTLAIGARASDYYGRVYDKYRESGEEEYRRCWRYEVEVKGDPCESLKNRVAQETSFTEEIPSLVHDWFSRRGVSVRYRPGLPYAFAAVGAVDTDAQRQLAWLKSQVAPTVRRLQEWYARRDLIDLLFDGADLGNIHQVRREDGLGLTAYDQWTIDAADRERS